MTESQIRSNIAHSEGIIDGLLGEKANIERKIADLGLLSKKIVSLQGRFEERQQHRQTMLQAVADSDVENKILEIYHEGMKDLLEGTEFQNAWEGLEEALRRILAESLELEGELSRCNGSIACQRGICDYWRGRLAEALAGEAE